MEYVVAARSKMDEGADLSTKQNGVASHNEAVGSGEDYVTRNFMICTSHQSLFG